MRQFSTAFTLGFAALVCVVCAILVAGSAVALKPMQDKNAVLDRQTKVLSVAGLVKEGQAVTAAEVGKMFAENIVPRVVTLKTGEIAADIDAATYDQGKAAKDPALSSAAPPTTPRCNASHTMRRSTRSAKKES